MDISLVTLEDVLANHPYLTTSPQFAAVEDGTIRLNISARRDETMYGWISVAKVDDQFVLRAYRGERGDSSDLLEEQVFDLEGELHKRQREENEENLLATLLELEIGESVITLDDLIASWISERQYALMCFFHNENLLKRVPSLRLTHAGGMMPFQAEGTLDGFPFYFRYRGGNATLKVGSPQNPEGLHFAPLYFSQMNYGDDLGGTLSHGEFEELFTTMVKELEPAPRLWDFEGTLTKDLHRSKAGDPSRMGTWGHTPEEAWERLTNSENYSIDADRWAEHLAVHNLDPKTVTVDDRVFPEKTPDFTVLD